MRKVLTRQNNFHVNMVLRNQKKEGVITVKYLIATQSYSIDGLCDQIMETNKLMFDGWHWSMSKGMLNFLDQDKGGAL